MTLPRLGRRSLAFVAAVRPAYPRISASMWRALGGQRVVIARPVAAAAALRPAWCWPAARRHQSRTPAEKPTRRRLRTESAHNVLPNIIGDIESDSAAREQFSRRRHASAAPIRECHRVAGSRRRAIAGYIVDHLHPQL